MSVQPRVCGDQNMADPDWPANVPTGCGHPMNVRQYTGVRIKRHSEETITISQPNQPGTCWVCPQCDSPGAGR